MNNIYKNIYFLDYRKLFYLILLILLILLKLKNN